jgi:hypothetical protein
MNFDFVLIDLYSQREAILRYVEGWSKQAVLAWMCQYGLITKPYTPNEWFQDHYLFTPFCCAGLLTAFTFEGDPSISQKHRIVVIA